MPRQIIEVDMPEELLPLIDERARAQGSDRNRVIQEIVDREFRIQRKTFDEILSPIRQGFAESRMSEEEVKKLLESELEAVRAERPRHAGS